MAEKVCERCGSTYLAGRGKHRWCEPCKTRTCEFCGAEFRITPRDDAQRFCSHRCQADSNAERSVSLFWQNVRERGECLEWSGPRNRAGYGIFYDRNAGKLAHRVAFEQAFGDLPSDACVLHRCDNRPCVEPSHLFLGSRKDNILDMIGKGRDRHPLGEDNGLTRLTEDQVRAIRRDRANGYKYRDIALRYDTDYTNVGKIVNGLTWKHLM